MKPSLSIGEPRIFIFIISIIYTTYVQLSSNKTAAEKFSRENCCLAHFYKLTPKYNI